MGDITLESNLKAILGPSFQARSGEGAAKTEDGETFSQTLAECDLLSCENLKMLFFCKVETYQPPYTVRQTL